MKMMTRRLNIAPILAQMLHLRPGFTIATYVTPEMLGDENFQGTPEEFVSMFISIAGIGVIGQYSLIRNCPVFIIAKIDCIFEEQSVGISRVMFTSVIASGNLPDLPTMKNMNEAIERNLEPLKPSERKVFHDYIFIEADCGKISFGCFEDTQLFNPEDMISYGQLKREFGFKLMFYPEDQSDPIDFTAIIFPA